MVRMRGCDSSCSQIVLGNMLACPAVAAKERRRVCKAVLSILMLFYIPSAIFVFLCSMRSLRLKIFRYSILPQDARHPFPIFHGHRSVVPQFALKYPFHIPRSANLRALCAYTLNPPPLFHISRFKINSP